MRGSARLVGVTDGERRTWRQVVDASYSDEVERFYEEHQSLLDESLDPRGPALFFDLAAELGLDASSHALDVGSRDGRHLDIVASRFGCRVTGVEPAEGNLARLRRRFGGASPHPVARGVAEALPFADATFDVAWARDVLVHVEPLATAFVECRRVLRPGAPLLVFNVFATPLLEPDEAARLFRATAAVPASVDRAAFERAALDAGFHIEHRDELASEWREHTEEHGGQSTSQQLLRVARLLRQPEHYRARIGAAAYDVEIGNCLFGIYQMIGKLSPALYVLR
jgi:ubiquinone/menaquinone biosynthesis C-methylase UbiE